MLYKFFILFLLGTLLHCSHLKDKHSLNLQQKTHSKNQKEELNKQNQISQTLPSLKFKNEQILKKYKLYKGLRVGGLSEIFFDESSSHFYALSDDKRNQRFYKLALKTKPRYHFEIQDQILLKSPKYKKLKRNMDPEALVFHEDDVFIASEGQQIFKIHEPTQIFTFDRKGFLKEAWPVPSVFWKKNQNPQSRFFGQQENKGFESLTIDKQSHTLWTATEKPLKQDLIFKNKAFVRLSAFDISNKSLKAQYGYPLHKAKEGGLTALQFLKPLVFISLERAYKKEKKKGVNEVQLFLTDCRKADNIQKYEKLPKHFKACDKKSLWSSSDKDSFQVDNLEALTLAPLPTENKTLLVLASDNNFNDRVQKTQFLFFEIDMKF